MPRPPHPRRLDKLIAGRDKSRGLLIAFEGPDGSGKTTQRKLLTRWLESRNHQVVSARWASSALVKPMLKVRKKMLARLKEDNDSLVISGVPLDEREMLVESQPKIFYFTDHYRDYPMVLIRLSKARRSHVEPLLRRQWRALASKAAVKAYDAELRRWRNDLGRIHRRGAVQPGQQDHCR